MATQTLRRGFFGGLRLMMWWTFVGDCRTLGLLRGLKAILNRPIGYLAL